METLVLDGKEFVKASKAAKDLGYTSDYVGQLCRGGKITAHLVGRTWYVRKDELSVHKVEKKRISRVKAREYAKKSIEEHRKSASLSKVISPVRLGISYEKDTTDLIPPTRKLNVSSAPIPNGGIENDTNSEISIENKDEKVVMSGELAVMDVTDELSDPETVFLSPKILKHSIQPVSEDRDKDIDEEDDNQPINFAERLKEKGLPVESVLDEDVESTNIDFSRPEDDAYVSLPAVQVGSIFPYVALIITLVFLTVLTLFVRKDMIYTHDIPDQITVKYSISYQDTLDKI